MPSAPNEPRLYVETSYLLRVILEGDDALRAPLLTGTLHTSALTFLESARAISRAKREGRLDRLGVREARQRLATFERGCDVMAVTEEALSRAREEFPHEPVRSLDAIHLASLRLLDEQLGGFQVATCDSRVRNNAIAMGFVVAPRGAATEQPP
jgi:predicted nucleic acid-binding protein